MRIRTYSKAQTAKGLRIHPTKEGVANFWRWFSRSHTVDEGGRPLVLYHGTNQNIDTFSTSRLGANTQTVSATGFFFTDDIREAEEYADMSAKKQVSNAPEREVLVAEYLQKIDRAYASRDFNLAEKLTLQLEQIEQEAASGEERGANIMPVFLNIKKVFLVDMKDGVDLTQVAQIIEEAKSAGYDGLKLENVFNPVGDRTELFSTTQWVAFEASQIKSAIGNSGAFSLASDHLCDAEIDYVFDTSRTVIREVGLDM